MDLEEYQKIREAAQKFYKNINKVFSPVLKEKVVFQSEGFNHIIFKSRSLVREESSQVMRFRLLRLAKELIELSTTYQEYEERLREIVVKKYKKRTKVNKVIRYWGLIAIMDNQKIKVIVRKVGDNGFLHFWSIIPAWSTNKHRDIKFFSTMRGSPEED